MRSRMIVFATTGTSADPTGTGMQPGVPEAVSRGFPARFGVHAAFWCARVLHVVTVALLAWAGVALDTGVFYWLGVVTVAALLAYEHAIVSPRDLRRLNMAFFTLNGVISIVFFGFVALDVAM